MSQYLEYTESYITRFIERCRENIIPRCIVQQEFQNVESFYNLAFPKEDLYKLIRNNAITVYYLCRGTDYRHKKYEFIQALVKIDPHYKDRLRKTYEVCIEIEDEQHLNNFINFLERDHGRHNQIVHYDHVVPDD